MNKKILLIGGSIVAVVVFSVVTAYATDIFSMASKKPNTENAMQSQVYVDDEQTEILKYENSSDITNLPEEYDYEMKSEISSIKDNVQEIRITLDSYEYPELTVQKNIPVKFIITADENNLNYCNNEIVISDYGISKKLELGENVIEFTPTETGVITYSCWMGMINSTIAVVDDINNLDEVGIQNEINALPPVGGCCGTIK